MRFSASLAALFTLFFGNSLYAQFGVYVPGRIYIAHTATGQEPVSPEWGLAPGSIAEINLQGIEENLGQARRVTLRIKTADTDEPRDLVVLNSQRSPGGIEIWFQVVIPADARLGPAELIATTDSGGTFTAPLHISAINFGVFRDDKYGFTHAKTDRSFTNPVIRGGYLTLWGTGLGRPLPSFAPVVKVSIGGVDVRPEYFGRAPGLAGVDQMNVRIPETGVPYACYVPVEVEVAGKPANQVTVPVADGTGPCRHPLNLTTEELQALDAGEAIPVVDMSMTTFAGPDPVSSTESSGPALYKRWDDISIGAWDRDAAAIAFLAMPLIPESERSSCTTSLLDGGLRPAFLRASPIEPASSSVTVNGPNFGPFLLPGKGAFNHALITETASLPLAALPPSRFEGGDWTFKRDETTSFAALQRTFAVPHPLRLKTQTITAVRRSEPLRIEWEDRGYSSSEFVTVTLTAGTASRQYAAPCAGRGSVPDNLRGTLVEDPR
jgi:hypothetical protein